MFFRRDDEPLVPVGTTIKVGDSTLTAQHTTYLELLSNPEELEKLQIVGMRTADFPPNRPPSPDSSSGHPCQYCGHDLTLRASTVELLHLYSKKPICNRCMTTQLSEPQA